MCNCRQARRSVFACEGPEVGSDTRVVPFHRPGRQHGRTHTLAQPHRKRYDPSKPARIGFRTDNLEDSNCKGCTSTQARPCQYPHPGQFPKYICALGCSLPGPPTSIYTFSRHIRIHCARYGQESLATWIQQTQGHVQH